MRWFVFLVLYVSVAVGCRSQVAPTADGAGESQDGSSQAETADATEGPNLNTSNEQPLEEISLSDAVKQVEAGSAVLVDVRSDAEWEKSHFAKAQHICIDEINEDPATALAGLDKETLVLLH